MRGRTVEAAGSGVGCELRKRTQPGGRRSEGVGVPKRIQHTRQPAIRKIPLCRPVKVKAATASTWSGIKYLRVRLPVYDLEEQR
jgi:hypothetical protein